VRIVGEKRVKQNERRFHGKRFDAFRLKTDVQKFSDTLELAFLIGMAMPAVYLMSGEEELQGRALQPPDRIGVRLDNHAGNGRLPTRNDRLGLSLNLHKAKSARSRGILHIF
jgi:hypothetical protein